MFNLDITSMEAKTTCPVTSSIRLLTLTDSNPWSPKSQHVTTEDSEVIWLRKKLTQCVPWQPTRRN